MSVAVRSGSNFCIGRSGSSKVLQKVGNAIYCINLYSVVTLSNFPNSYLSTIKPKKEKSGTLVLSLVLDVHIPHLCLAIHLDRPITSVSRLSEIRMSKLLV